MFTALVLLFATIVVIMDVASSDGASDNKEQKEKKKEKIFRPDTPKEEVNVLFKKIANHEFTLEESHDKAYRTISVKGLEHIRLVWMNTQWDKRETFLIEKNYKKYLFFEYESKKDVISSINDKDSLFYYDLVPGVDIFEYEWSKEEIETMKKAVQTVSKVCKGEVLHSKMKSKNSEEIKKQVEKELNDSFKQKETILSDDINIVWNHCLRLKEELMKNDLNIEGKHHIESLVTQGEKLMIHYQKLSSSLQKQQQTSLTDSLTSILHNLQSTKDKIDREQLYEFEKATRIVKEYQAL